MTASQPLYPLAELSPAELAEIERFGIFEPEETVEKVARALWEANPMAGAAGWRELAEDARDWYRRMAAAAIAAMPVSRAEEALRRVEAVRPTIGTVYGPAILEKDLRAALGAAPQTGGGQ